MRDWRRERKAAGAACLLAGMLAALCICVPEGHAAAAARRFVSINMCADELLLQLAAPESIAAITHLAQDPRNSAFADRAAAFPATGGRAEKVMALAPDLVLASTFTAPSTLAMLRRLGVPLAVLDVPATFETIAAQVREVAQLLGQPEAGERAVRDMDGRLADLERELPLPPATALVLQANNVVVGAGTLADSVLTRAGLVNIAAQAGIIGYGRMSLEAITGRPPDVLILEGGNADAPALATRQLQHPALAALVRTRDIRIVHMPSRLWVCAGPSAVEAVAHLRRTLQDMRRQVR